MFDEKYANEKAWDQPRNKLDKNCFLEIPRPMLMYNLPESKVRIWIMRVPPIEVSQVLCLRDVPNEADLIAWEKNH